MPRQLINERQLSQSLQIPVETVRYWRKVGRGPAWVKIGRNVRYDSAVIDQFIEDNTRIPSVRTFMEEKRVNL